MVGLYFLYFLVSSECLQKCHDSVTRFIAVSTVATSQVRENETRTNSDLSAVLARLPVSTSKTFPPLECLYFKRSRDQVETRKSFRTNDVSTLSTFSTFYARLTRDAHARRRIAPGWEKSQKSRSRDGHFRHGNPLNRRPRPMTDSDRALIATSIDRLIAIRDNLIEAVKDAKLFRFQTRRASYRGEQSVATISSLIDSLQLELAEDRFREERRTRRTAS
jgi:hypothetical protein